MSKGLCQCGCDARTSISKQNHKKKGWVKGQPLRFLKGHDKRKSSVPYIVNEQTGCWEWQGGINSGGYGVLWTGIRPESAHRYYYKRDKGEIPTDKQIDHLCRSRSCVNPDHLEAVPCAVNLHRGMGTKLTPQQVDEIRIMHKRKEGSQVEIGERFGVSDSLVCMIVNHKIWSTEHGI